MQKCLSSDIYKWIVLNLFSHRLPLMPMFLAVTVKKSIYRCFLTPVDKFDSNLENPIPLRILYPSAAASGLVGLLMSWGNVQL